MPIELTNGNDGRGSKWFSSAKVRDRLELRLRSLGHVRTPFPFPVVVHVTRILGRRQQLWDASSCGRGNFKELEDSLVVLGWFHDDGPKFIKEVRFFQLIPPERKDPSVVIQIYQYEPANITAGSGQIGRIAGVQSEPCLRLTDQRDAEGTSL